MRLKQIEVIGLFGIFDHILPFKEGRTTVIIGPNGVGKTVLLKIINSFFQRRFRALLSIPFKKIIFSFDDDTAIIITKEVRERELERPRRQTVSEDILVFTIAPHQKLTDDVPPPWEFTNRRASNYSRRIQREHPYLRRVGPDLWRDVTDGELIPEDELYRRLGYLDPRITAVESEPEWLSEATSVIKCRFIETQRLLHLTENEGGPVEPVVARDAEELAKIIQRTLAEYASFSQRLDQTFPRRAISETGEPDTEVSLRQKLEALDDDRNELMNVGLLDQQYSLPIEFGSVEKLDDSMKRVLQVYASDTREKLDSLRGLYSKILAFTQILNEKFRYKKLQITRDEGIKVLTENSEALPLQSLSSGEQHELVLLYELLFKTEANTLILIDEPELSLHVAWQKKFLPDLQRVMQLSDLDALVATHSPQIINDRWDLTVELGGKVDG